MNARVAVVTGASAGIGRATAIAFASRGWRVALLARGGAGLEVARREVNSAGGQALVIPVDVADAQAVFAAAHRIAEAWGRLDVWVNNAMATVFGPTDRIPSDEWKRVTEVTWSMGRSQHSSTCVRKTGARSCKSDRRSPTARSHYRDPIAQLKRRCAASRTPCVANSCTTKAG